MESCRCGSKSAYDPITGTPPLNESITEDTAMLYLFIDLPPELQDAI